MTDEYKIYISSGKEDREGLVKYDPSGILTITDNSVDEIQGQDILEKVPDLIDFIDECHRILKPGCKAMLTCPHFLSDGAWRSPLTIRALTPQSLNFADKNWREQTKYTEAEVTANFEVQGSFAMEPDVMNRAEEVRNFWMRRYANVAQALMFTLIKREP